MIKNAVNIIPMKRGVYELGYFRLREISSIIKPTEIIKQISYFNDTANCTGVLISP